MQKERGGTRPRVDKYECVRCVNVKSGRERGRLSKRERSGISPVHKSAR